MKPKAKQQSSIIDQLRERPAPYYNHFLYQEGYQPYEILWSEDSPEDRYILQQHLERHYGKQHNDRRREEKEA